MGGKPKSREEKKLDGTFQPYREVKNEFLPESVDSLPMPEGLNEYAKKEWLTQTAHLSKEGLLVECDYSSLLMYCMEVGYYYEYNILANPPVITIEKSGYKQVNPYKTLANQAFKAANQLAKEFGFTIISRQKIEAVKPPEDIDPLDDL